jgi:hypothetical protein
MALVDGKNVLSIIQPKVMLTGLNQNLLKMKESLANFLKIQNLIIENF